MSEDITPEFDKSCVMLDEMIAMYTDMYIEYEKNEKTATLYDSHCENPMPIDKAYELKEKERLSLLSYVFKHDIQVARRAIGFVNDVHKGKSIRMYACLEDFVREHVYGSCVVYHDTESGRIVLKKKGLQITVMDLSGVGECIYRTCLNSRKFPSDKIKEYAIKSMLIDKESLEPIRFTIPSKHPKPLPAICIY